MIMTGKKKRDDVEKHYKERLNCEATVRRMEQIRDRKEWFNLIYFLQ